MIFYCNSVFWGSENKQEVNNSFIRFAGRLKAEFSNSRKSGKKHKQITDILSSSPSLKAVINEEIIPIDPKRKNNDEINK